MCDQRVMSTAPGICMSMGELMVGAGSSLTRVGGFLYDLIFCLCCVGSQSL